MSIFSHSDNFSSQQARRIGWTLALAALPLIWAFTPQASPAPRTAASTVPLGRDNPFRPLIVPAVVPSAGSDGAGVLPPPMPILPGPGGVLMPPGGPPQPVPSPAPAVAFLGVAYDRDPNSPDGESVTAAVRVNGVVRFVHLGDRVADSVVVSISPQRIVLQTAKRTYEVRKRPIPGAR